MAVAGAIQRPNYKRGRKGHGGHRSRKLRSRFHPGMAAAMATQWGGITSAMSFISNLRNWAAQRMAVGPGTDSGPACTLQDTANYFAGTSAGASVYETAAVEFAVGMVGRAAMAAEVKVSGATLDPHTMAQLFRQTILLGESVQLIDLNRRTGMIRLLPIATRPIITGGPDAGKLAV